MKLISARSGWLIANNRLFWTDSLGSSWTEVTPSAAQVSSVYFNEAGSGWALTTDTSGAFAVARTTDKGAHWSNAPLPSPYENGLSFSGKSSVSFPDAVHGFVMLKTQSSASSSMGVLFATVDGGAHWTRLPAPPTGGAILFTDAQHGFAGPGPMGNELYSTTDGGHIWHLSTIGAATERGEIALPYFSDAQHGYLLKTITGDNGTSVVRYNTADGGASWSKDATVAQSAAHAPVIVAADGSVVAAIAPRKVNTNKLTISQANPTQTQNAVLETFGSQNEGWVLFRGGGCQGDTCTQTQSLMGTMDGGKTFFSLALPGDLQMEGAKTFTVAAPATGSGLAANYLKPDGTVSVGPAGTVTSPAAGVMGYDTCAIMSTSQMQDWYTNSPYRVAGIYIGGADWGCRSGGAPSATQISAALAQGWGMIPIWVGPQANTNQSVLLPSTTTAAYSTGVTEADSAVTVAANLGLGTGSIIYYDMEAYSRTSTNIALTQAFLNGWFGELHTKGYLGAVYSSHPELQDWEPSKMTTPPDVIWFAWFFNSGVACGTQCQTVYGVSDIPDNLWTDHHRVRQTSSGFHSTYGSTTYNIDEDWADAPVNYAGKATPTVSLAASATTLYQGQTASITVSFGGPSGVAAPTGSVTLKEGATSLGTATISQGTATFTSIALALGSHLLTAEYSGDTNWNAATSLALTITVNPPAFAASGSSSNLSISVQQGHSQTASVSFMPEGNFTGTIALACTGMPSSATCSFSPATLTGDGSGTTKMTSTLTVTAAASAMNMTQKSRGIFFALLFLPVMLMPSRRFRGAAVRRVLVMVVLFAGGMAATSLMGCGGSSSTPPSSGPVAPVYSGTIQVTATSGSTTVQVPVQLTITH